MVHIAGSNNLRNGNVAFGMAYDEEVRSADCRLPSDEEPAVSSQGSSDASWREDEGGPSRTSRKRKHDKAGASSSSKAAKSRGKKLSAPEHAQEDVEPASVSVDVTYFSDAEETEGNNTQGNAAGKRPRATKRATRTPTGESFTQHLNSHNTMDLTLHLVDP